MLNAAKERILYAMFFVAFKIFVLSRSGLPSYCKKDMGVRIFQFEAFPKIVS